MIITEILSRNARCHGEKIALVERDPARSLRREITWKEFDRQASLIANALIAKKIRKSDAVVQLMTNAIEWLPIYFGILRTGAMAVPLNFRFMADKILLCSKLSDARAVIFGEEFIDRIGEIRHELKERVLFWVFTGPEKLCPPYAEHIGALLSDGSPEDPQVEIKITDDAAIYFTSGTTGTPKGVLLTHRNLEFACIVEKNHHGQTHDDNFLCIPPLYHTGAKMHWFGNFISGATTVILKGVKPEWILEAVSEEKITIVWLLVPWAYDILNAIEDGAIDRSKYNLDQWRLMHIGAQPVPGNLISRWRKLFPGHEYDTNYGLTESTGPGCVHLGRDNIHKIGAIGIPGFGWECMIVNRERNEVPDGEPGELMIKGAGVMKEYHKNPEESAKALHGGWLLTGDVARKDKDGFIWLLDRKKDVIITGGENIYPVEIEDFLMGHSKIKDAAVIGVPDKRLGEIAMAVIQVKDNVKNNKDNSDPPEEEFRIFCEKLERYKRPRIFIFDDVPRNPTGKIEKPKLRKKFTGVTSCFTG